MRPPAAPTSCRSAKSAPTSPPPPPPVATRLDAPYTATRPNTASTAASRASKRVSHWRSVTSPPRASGTLRPALRSSGTCRSSSTRATAAPRHPAARRGAPAPPRRRTSSPARAAPRRRAPAPRADPLLRTRSPAGTARAAAGPGREREGDAPPRRALGERQHGGIVGVQDPHALRGGVVEQQPLVVVVGGH